jgi:hypothetical protein
VCQGPQEGEEGKGREGEEEKERKVANFDGGPRITFSGARFLQFCNDIFTFLSILLCIISVLHPGYYIIYAANAQLSVPNNVACLKDRGSLS